MKILLLSMPDSFEHTPALAMRFPNGALASLAGNVDPHHTVSIADLILAQRSVVATVTRPGHRAAARRRRSLGDDLSAEDRAEGDRARQGASSAGCHRGRRLRPEPRAGGVRRRRVGRGRDCPWRGRRHVQGTAPRARGRRGARTRGRALVPDAARFRPDAAARSDQARKRRRAPAESSPRGC